MSCRSSSSRLSTTTAAGVSALSVTTRYDGPSASVERRQPAGGGGGEEHELRRRVGDHVVVAALAPADQAEAAVAGGARWGAPDERSWGLDSVGVLLCTLTLRPKCQATVWTT